METANEYIARLGRRAECDAGLRAVGLLDWPVDGPLIHLAWLTYGLMRKFFLVMRRQIAVSFGFDEVDLQRLRPPKKRPNV